MNQRRCQAVQCYQRHSKKGKRQAHGDEREGCAGTVVAVRGDTSGELLGERGVGIKVDPVKRGSVVDGGVPRETHRSPASSPSGKVITPMSIPSETRRSLMATPLVVRY